MRNCTYVQSMRLAKRAFAAGKPVPTEVDMPIIFSDISTLGIYSQEIPKATEKRNKKNNKKAGGGGSNKGGAGRMRLKTGVEMKE
ncbi:hypothetical protein PQX77_001478 [Marasmius sp. AFHP31]|nr:hypothetical protein PQX77_001478 [Marasmius sp. AFHP31]